MFLFITLSCFETGDEWGLGDNPLQNSSLLPQGLSEMYTFHYILCYDIAGGWTI
jgi:hypothetical protein